MKNSAAKMTSTGNNGQQVKTHEETPTEQDDGLSFETSISSLEIEEDETISSQEGFVSASIDIIKTILDEEQSVPPLIAEDILFHELEQFEFNATQDTDETASDIVDILMEENNLESESESDVKSSCWTKVGNKIKILFMLRFAKESAIKLLANLKIKCCDDSFQYISLVRLLDGVEWVVEGMIPPENEENRKDTPQECLYKKVSSDISSRGLVIQKWISNLMYNTLQPKGQRQEIMDLINGEVDYFMKLMWNWVNQQAQELERKRGPMSKALRKIKREAVNLPALTEGRSQKERDNLSPEVKEVFTADETAECNEAPAPTAGEAAECDEAPATTAGEAAECDEAPAPTTDGAAECDEAPAPTADGAAECDEAPAPTTGEAAECDEATGGTIVDLVQEQEKLCHLIVTGLVSQILKDQWVHVSLDVIKTIITALKKTLLTEMAGSDFTVKTSPQHIKKIIKAVYKDLREDMGSVRLVQLNLLLQEERIYKHISKALKRHLTPPKKTGIRRFFRCVFKALTNH